MPVVTTPLKAARALARGGRAGAARAVDEKGEHGDGRVVVKQEG